MLFLLLLPTLVKSHDELRLRAGLRYVQEAREICWLRHVFHSTCMFAETMSMLPWHGAFIDDVVGWNHSRGMQVVHTLLRVRKLAFEVGTQCCHPEGMFE